MLNSNLALLLSHVSLLVGWDYPDDSWCLPLIHWSSHVSVLWSISFEDFIKGWEISNVMSRVFLKHWSLTILLHLEIDLMRLGPCIGPTLKIMQTLVVLLWRGSITSARSNRTVDTVHLISCTCRAATFLTFFLYDSWSRNEALSLLLTVDHACKVTGLTQLRIERILLLPFVKHEELPSDRLLLNQKPLHFAGQMVVVRSFLNTRMSLGSTMVWYLPLLIVQLRLVTCLPWDLALLLNLFLSWELSGHEFVKGVLNVLLPYLLSLGYWANSCQTIHMILSLLTLIRWSAVK